MVNSENSQFELQNLLDAHHEWLLIDPAGKSFSFQNTEIEIDFERGKTAFQFFGRQRFSNVARCRFYEQKSEEIVLEFDAQF